ncbi:MAG TPA: hypothetical protein VGN86_15945 [Pyrinomonadaceae bacterium]|jgi:hypothetical protein|nr:hypothetical protein [Pyrinomonadaceae bacterium]
MNIAKSFFFLFLMLAAASSLPVKPSHAGAALKEEYTGTVIGKGGRLGGVSRPFTLVIEGQTSAAEANDAVSMLAEGGQDALLKRLHDRKLGYFSMGAQLGRDISFVQETATGDGGRRIVVLFERWLNTFEIMSGARSEDYPFTYIEITLDSSGKGQGRLIAAAKVTFDKKHGNQIEVENYGIYPADLQGVQLRK